MSGSGISRLVLSLSQLISDYCYCCNCYCYLFLSWKSAALKDVVVTSIFALTVTSRIHLELLQQLSLQLLQLHRLFCSLPKLEKVLVCFYIMFCNRTGCRWYLWHYAFAAVSQSWLYKVFIQLIETALHLHGIVFLSSMSFLVGILLILYPNEASYFTSASACMKIRLCPSRS